MVEPQLAEKKSIVPPQEQGFWRSVGTNDAQTAQFHTADKNASTMALLRRADDVSNDYDNEPSEVSKSLDSRGRMVSVKLALLEALLVGLVFSFTPHRSSTGLPPTARSSALDWTLSSVLRPECRPVFEENHRRQFIEKVLTGFVTVTFIGTRDVTPAAARGLVQFPCTKPLGNTYHFLRAGTTLLEQEDIWSTNPLFLTNREAALSDKGIAQIQAVCDKLEQAQINPSVIKYSFAASSMDTATIVADRLKVGQNKVVPEFNFMDPRAIGKWDMMSTSEILPAVIAMDDSQAGKDGAGGRPPANDDGTPNETLADNSVRLTQLMSGT